MITRDDLLQRVDKAIRTEERVVPLYLENYSSALSWLELDDDVRDHIARAFKQMAQESKRHRDVLEGVRKRILKGARDVF